MAGVAQVSGKAVVDSTHMLIGDQMRLRIELSAPKDAVLEPLNLAVVAADSVFEILAESKWDTLGTSGDKLRLQKNLLFIAWDSGYHRLPAIPIGYKLGGRTDTFFTRDIPIQVDLPKVDTALADIKPILTEPVKLQDFIWYIVGLALLALAIVLVLVLRTRKKNVVLPPPPVVQLLPHELALQQLDALAQQQMWQSGAVKGYHSALTHIVRGYLENRYGIQALEQTTDEILEQLRKRDFDLALAQKLGDVLQTADLVKFAKAQPTAEFHEQAMVYARAFILETKPAEIQLHEALNTATTRANNGDSPEIFKVQTPFELAGFWPRFFARLIDLLTIFILIILSATAIGILSVALDIDLPKIWVYLTYAVVAWAYSALLEYRNGKTLGKLICNIEVVDVQGNQISFGKSCIRTLSKFLLSETLLWIGFLLFFFDKNHRQTLHDKIAGTLVIKRQPKQLAVFQNPSAITKENVQ
ncbi:MAG: RDD family protein [Saprospiraceae bacterium]|nr:RDD family protein [Saprospiraceae bacterium]